MFWFWCLSFDGPPMLLFSFWSDSRGKLPLMGIYLPQIFSAPPENAGSGLGLSSSSDGKGWSVDRGAERSRDVAVMP